MASNKRTLSITVENPSKLQIDALVTTLRQTDVEVFTIDVYTTPEDPEK